MVRIYVKPLTRSQLWSGGCRGSAAGALPLDSTTILVLHLISGPGSELRITYSPSAALKIPSCWQRLGLEGRGHHPQFLPAHRMTRAAEGRCKLDLVKAPFVGSQYKVPHNLILQATRRFWADGIVFTRTLPDMEVAKLNQGFCLFWPQGLRLQCGLSWSFWLGGPGVEIQRYSGGSTGPC